MPRGQRLGSGNGVWMNKVRRHIVDSCYKLDAGVNTSNPNLGRLRSLVDWSITWRLVWAK